MERRRAIYAGAACAAAGVIAAWWQRKRRDRWEAMLDRVLPAIVVIRVNYVKPFDGAARRPSAAVHVLRIWRFPADAAPARPR